VEDHTFDIKELHKESQAGLHIGSIQDVIESKVDSRLKNRRFDASDFLLGFEIGSPLDFTSLGESVVTHGLCFTHSTDTASKNYRSLIVGDSFVTSGMLLLPKSAQVTHKAQFVSHRHPPSLYELYKKIYMHVKKPLVFAGVVNFLTLHSQAIAKSPTHGLNIFENSDHFYPYPSEKASVSSVYMVGALCDPNDPMSAKLRCVLYHNPTEAPSKLEFHAHGLILNQPLKGSKEFKKDMVTDCRHIYADSSIVLSADLEIFTLSSMRDYIS
jgi:hypothetical protein